MKNIDNIDYGELSNTDIFKLNQKAYTYYYNKEFKYDESDDDFICEVDDGSTLSYNDWYDNIEIHQRCINLYLRKQKLIKIKKADN